MSFSSSPEVTKESEASSQTRQSNEIVEINVIPKLDTDATGKQCPNTYGGVGLRYAEGSRVLEVYAGYPAYKAGIKPGDVLYSKEDLRGEPGTKVEVTIVRDNNYININIIREKICYD